MAILSFLNGKWGVLKKNLNCYCYLQLSYFSKSNSRWLHHNSDYLDPKEQLWWQQASSGSVKAWGTERQGAQCKRVAAESTWAGRGLESRKGAQPLTVWLFSMNCTALSFTSFLTLLYVRTKEEGQGKSDAKLRISAAEWALSRWERFLPLLWIPCLDSLFVLTIWIWHCQMGGKGILF